MKLGLTAAQLVERRKGIGGSDARYIVEGEWHKLWLDKTGRSEPDDLSRVLAVQMGNATEEFNAYWYELTSGRLVTSRGELRFYRDASFMRCTLDGIIGENEAVWQAKHVNAFSKIEDVVARYTPQVTHEMIVCGLDRAVLSVFIGTDKFEAVEIEIDEFFAATYVDRCREFWGYVERDEPPPQGAPLAVPAPVDPKAFRSIDIAALLAEREGNPEAEPLPNWIGAIQPEMTTWLETHVAAKKNEKAVKDIKEILPADVSPCTFGGVEITRNKAGSVSVKKAKEGK